MKGTVGVLQKIDFWLIFLYLILIFFGWINVYSANYSIDHSHIFDFSQKHGKHFIWIIISLSILFVILLIDSKFYSFIAYPSYVISILLLLIVFVVAKEVHGSRSWIQIGGFHFQPSEFAKIAVSLTLAKIMSRQSFSIKRLRDLILIAFVILLPIFLILLQNDTGSALVYLSFIILLYRGGLNSIFVFLFLSAIVLFFLILVLNKLYIFIGLTLLFFLVFVTIVKRKKEFILWLTVFLSFLVLAYALNFLFEWNIRYYKIYVAASILFFVIFITVNLFRLLFSYAILALIFSALLVYSLSIDFVYNNVLELHQRKRINVLLGIENDPLGAGYNVIQSKISIGSGGSWGKGFLKGTQTKYDFVPEQSTDFIFCTIGEEYGFVGSFVFLLVYLLFMIRIIFIAERQRSIFSMMYGYAVVSLLFFHFMLNVGMTLGLMPVIGIPLPFISYGGSSLLGFTIMIGILLRLDLNRNEIIT